MPAHPFPAFRPVLKQFMMPIIVCLCLMAASPVFAQQVTVPNLINLSSIEAFRALKNQGLYMKQGQITPTGQRELTDKVYKQYTRAGTLVNKGHIVKVDWYTFDIKLYKPKIGTQKKKVPTLYNLGKTHATNTLYRAGLYYKIVDQPTSNRAYDGTVAGQNPDPGTYLLENSPVTVYVFKYSSNLTSIRVPNVISYWATYAPGQVKKYGFKVSVSKVAVREKDKNDKVLNMRPRPGYAAKPGSTVILVVGKYEPYRIPNLVNWPVPRAMAELKRQGYLTLGPGYTITYDPRLGGKVKYTHPAGGEKVDYPKRTVVTVHGWKYTPLKVPNIIGYWRAGAEVALKRYPLKYRFHTVVTGDKKWAEKVMRTIPAVGAQVGLGSTVNVFLGKYTKP